MTLSHQISSAVAFWGQFSAASCGQASGQRLLLPILLLRQGLTPGRSLTGNSEPAAAVFLEQFDRLIDFFRPLQLVLSYARVERFQIFLQPFPVAFGNGAFFPFGPH